MTDHKYYLGNIHNQTSVSAGFEVLEPDTGPPQSHAVIQLNDGSISIVDKSALEDAGEFHHAHGFAIVLIKFGPQSDNIYTQHAPWRLRSLSSKGWCECEEPSSGTWLLAPPREIKNEGSDRTTYMSPNTNWIAVQSFYLISAENIDHYYEGTDRVNLNFKDPYSKAYLELGRVNHQLRSQNK